ncbi:MAG: dihydroorotate dehydrogenase [Candidatus Omnitrophica bacterium]|nr:dihydroorotate dehydrogenase [Candidatus Omnitrophota bacterium]
MDLSVKIGRLKLKNPVTVASGTFGYAEEFKELVNLEGLGAIITKTITKEPRLGNAAPRLAETSSGMLNAIGLQNEGLDNFLKVKLPKLKKIGTKIIVSVSANSAQEFIYCVKQLEDSGVEAIELNLSCPNIKYAKLAKTNKAKARIFAQVAGDTYTLVNALAKKTNTVLIAKLSPNVTDITEIALAAQKAGADALSLVNTFSAMAIDIDTHRPRLANVSGGLSGPAIKPIAVKMVYDVAQAVKIPIIGMGGIMNADDAIEFIIAGAAAVSVGTANFVNPGISMEVIEGIKNYCKKKKLKNIKQLIGTLKR